MLRNIAISATLLTLLNASSAYAVCFQAEGVTHTTATPCLMTLNASGELSIGTTATNALLHIASNDSVDNATASAAIIRFGNTSTANNRTTLRMYKRSGVDTGATHFADMRINNVGTLEFATGRTSAELTPVRLAISAAGNVGIGITPVNTLDVGGSIRGQRYFTDSTLVESVSGNYDPTKSVYRFNENRGWGYNAADDAIYYAANERVPIVFRGNGRVGIGTTDPQTALHVEGTARFYSLEVTNTDNQSKIVVSGYGGGKGYGIVYRPFEDGGAVRPAWFLNAAGTVIGSISTTSAATAYNTTSDYRLKENVIPISNALSKVSALNPTHFNFKNDENNEMDGFIAHEVQAVAPYAVTGVKDAQDKDGLPIYQQVDYAKLTPLLTAAIQELSVEVRTLRAEIEVLKSGASKQPH